MRLKLAIAALLVCGVGFVLHERKSALENHLGTVATELGGRHVHVHCQSFTGNLLDVSSEAGSVQFDASGIPSDTTDLKCPICSALARFPHDVKSPDYACVYSTADCPQKIRTSRTRTASPTASTAAQSTCGRPTRSGPSLR
jgi:hypothetical protein